MYEVNLIRPRRRMKTSVERLILEVAHLGKLSRRLSRRLFPYCAWAQVLLSILVPRARRFFWSRFENKARRPSNLGFSPTRPREPENEVGAPGTRLSI